MAEDIQASSLPTFAQMGGVPYSPPAEDATPKDANSDNILRNFMNQSLADPLASIYKQQSEAEGDVARAKLRQQQTGLAGKARAESGYAAGLHQKYAAAEPELMAPPPKFNVTKDTQEGLVGLAALMTVGGLIIGSKGMTSGVNAMNAMTGVMKGYQEGNKERIDFETKKYEKEMDNWKTHLQQVKDSLSRYEKLASVDLNAATAKAASDAAAQGQDVIAAQIKANGITQTRQLVEKLMSQTQSTKPTAVLDTQTGQTTFATPAQITANPERYQPVSASGRGSGGSALMAGRADIVKNAIGQVAADVHNISLLDPDKTVLGAFAGMTGESGANLLSSLQNTFARTVTDTDTRMFQQLITGLETNLSMALGEGYASSGAKYRIQQYQAQIPKAGDDGFAVATFLGRVRQEMNVLANGFKTKQGATPAMIEQVQESNNIINTAIPFTIDDVIKARQIGTAPPTTSRQSYKAGDIIPAGNKKYRALNDGVNPDVEEVQ